MSAIVVAGDIGGTNSRFRLIDVPPGLEDVPEYELQRRHRIIARQEYKNDDYESFSAVLNTFLDNAGLEDMKISVACFAVAGPVTNNSASLTNRNWIINAEELETTLGIARVVLINDFVANGFGLLTLEPTEYDEIQEGEPSDDAPKALIGAGTGLGECFLTSQKGRYEAYPSEGGHVDWAPRNPIQDKLLQSLRIKFGKNGDPGRVSTERIVSGKGIINVYEFLAAEFPEKKAQHQRLHDLIMSSKEPAKEISTSAYDYPLAMQTMEIMMGAYGAETGNLGLTLIPLGGIYVAGGIAPHNMQYISNRDSAFLKAFRDKGRLSTVLDKVPIRVVRSEDLGLRGAHVKAVRELIDSLEPIVARPMPTRRISMLDAEEHEKDREPELFPRTMQLAVTLGLVGLLGFAIYKHGQPSK